MCCPATKTNNTYSGLYYFPSLQVEYIALLIPFLLVPQIKLFAYFASKFEYDINSR